jgi:hypothetical protein
MGLWDDFRALIDADQPFALEHYPTISALIAAGVTVSGTVKGPASERLYPDPTFAQYAAIAGRPAALGVLLRRTAPADFDSVFAPRDSNTKGNLLVLAIAESHDAVVELVLAHIGLLFPGAVPAYLAAEAPDRATALTVAVRLERWGALAVLLRHGGDLLAAPSVGLSAFGRVLLDHPARLAQLLDACRDRAAVVAAMVGQPWSPQLSPAPGGCPLREAVADLLPSDDAAEALEALRAVDPRVGQEPTVVIRRDEVATCAVRGCTDTTDLWHCPRCGSWVCVRHTDDHDCPESLCEVQGCEVQARLKCSQCSMWLCSAHRDDHDCHN